MRCRWFDCRRGSYEQLNGQVDRLILLRQFDAAVQCLLSTDNGQPDYYQNCLKASLLSAVHSSTACQSTVKLVATNLIASGKISGQLSLLQCQFAKVDTAVMTWEISVSLQLVVRGGSVIYMPALCFVL